jgi:putative oxidoreductase
MKKFIKMLVNTNAGYGMLFLRLMLGVIFMAHGSQKLFGIFGGYGLEGTGKYMDSIGLSPGYLMALLAGLGEFIGGLLLFLGLLGRMAAGILMFVAIVGLISVHIDKGFFISNGGFEYILMLFIAAMTVLIEGSGMLSIDKLIYKNIGSYDGKIK